MKVKKTMCGWMLSLLKNIKLEIVCVLAEISIDI